MATAFAFCLARAAAHATLPVVCSSVAPWTMLVFRSDESSSMHVLHPISSSTPVSARVDWCFHMGGDGLVDPVRPRMAHDDGAWRKVLYVSQPYPDNHVGGTFLDQVVLNATHVDVEFSTVFLAAVDVVRQLSLVVMASCACHVLREDKVSCAAVVGVDVLLLLLLTPRRRGEARGVRVRRALAWTCAVGVSAPVLRSLAKTISTDTIVALAVGLFLTHLYCHDYTQQKQMHVQAQAKHAPGGHEGSESTPGTSDRPWYGSVGISSAFGATVLLASRLQCNMDACVFLVLSLELFVLLPRVQMGMVASSALAVGSVVWLATLSRVMADYLLHTYVFVLLVCPFWLVRIQRGKMEIKGPWDEAKPEGIQLSPASSRRDPRLDVLEPDGKVKIG